MYAHSSTTYIIQLQGRFKEMIIKMLEKEGIPADIYYLCVAESMLQPLASPAGAKGYWQFTDATAKSFGLFVSREVDERYNWEKATAAACRYLKKGYEKYGNWTLAAASYNIGFANVDKRVAEQGTKEVGTKENETKETSNEPKETGDVNGEAQQDMSTELWHIERFLRIPPNLALT